MAQGPQIVDATQRKHFEQQRLVERISENGTISAAVMVLAAVAAVVCANTGAYDAIHHFLVDPRSFLVLGGVTVSFEVFVNDFLMAIFFLLVGIELKFEMTVGELKRPKQALLPMLAAVGGVIVPAGIYVALNHAGAVQGWAIPMATDIAFALGVLSLLGKRVPVGVRVFFTTLAIADDLLSIAAIAIFYGHSPQMGWLLAALAVIAVLIFFNRSKTFNLAPYMLLGLLLWYCIYRSGVHATLAGVILAFTIPAQSNIRLNNLTAWLKERLPDLADKYDDEAHVLGQHDFTRAAAGVERIMHHVTPPLMRLERKISGPVNFIILPIFAFVNAQVRLVGVDLGALAVDPVTLGTYFGMVLGKPFGIIGVTFILVKLGVASLPRRVTWPHIVGVGILGGIGFTMSILISGLAFPGVAGEEQLLAAKAAILVASLTSGVVGMVFMSGVCKKKVKQGPNRPAAKSAPKSKKVHTGQTGIIGQVPLDGVARIGASAGVGTAGGAGGLASSAGSSATPAAGHISGQSLPGKPPMVR